ncbi:MAG: hypothetical protein JWN84_2542 [Nocardioides sp.]|nr:hypothetical protein [Nocardioides sp.]
MKALAALVLVLALTGCAGSDDAAVPADLPSPSRASQAPVDLAGTDVCGLVREGIDAFNLDDLDLTVEKFEAAVPLAEDLAADQPSDETETLLDAVRYYAELPTDEYVEANQSSPEFLRFKDFTLSECAYTVAPGEPSDTGVPA